MCIRDRYAIDETEIGGEKFFLMEHEEHGDMAACVAVNEQGKLVAEDLWNGFDEDFQEAVQKYLSEKWNMPKKEDVVSEIIEKAAPVPDNSAQDYSDVPVYYKPFSYAKENDEVDLYRTSYRLNSECKQAIHEAIADNYDGMYLGDGAVDQVVKQYGMERVGYILEMCIRDSLHAVLVHHLVQQSGSGLLDGAVKGGRRNIDLILVLAACLPDLGTGDMIIGGRGLFQADDGLGQLACKVVLDVYKRQPDCHGRRGHRGR